MSEPRVTRFLTDPIFFALLLGGALLTVWERRSTGLSLPAIVGTVTALLARRPEPTYLFLTKGGTVAKEHPFRFRPMLLVFASLSLSLAIASVLAPQMSDRAAGTVILGAGWMSLLTWVLASQLPRFRRLLRANLPGEKAPYRPLRAFLIGMTVGCAFFSVTLAVDLYKGHSWSGSALLFGFGFGALFGAAGAAGLSESKLERAPRDAVIDSGNR